MRSVVLRAAASVLHPVLLLFSLFLLVRGHEEPGGGFSAGLVSASAYIFYGAAHGVRASRRLLRLRPLTVLVAGLAVALTTALLPVLLGGTVLGASWWEGSLPLWGELKLGTPLAFDVGVYLTVAGATLTTFYAVMETRG